MDSDNKSAEMSREDMLSLLQELVACRAPAGQEGEIDVALRRHFEATGAEVWQDDVSNICAHLPGPGPKVLVCAHKDEIGMIVVKVEENGRLRVRSFAGARPWKYGEGPVDILADDGSTIRAILSVGSMQAKSGPLKDLDSSQALTWDLVTLFTGLKPQDLEARGVHIGSYAVVARERRRVERLGDYFATFVLDDRVGLVVLIGALREMCGWYKSAPAAGQRPDLYFVATHGEEPDMVGVVRAAHSLRPDVVIALDNCPVAHGVALTMDGRPAVFYGEGRVYNDKAQCDRLIQLGKELGIGAQPYVYEGAGTFGCTDAGRIKQQGLAGCTLALGCPSDNSHGFEIAHLDGPGNMQRLLVAYLTRMAAGPPAAAPLPAAQPAQQLHMVWPRDRLCERLTWSVPAGYRLRTWQEGDGDGYTRLARGAGFKTWTLERTLQESLPAGLFFVVEEAGGGIVATALARHQPSQWHPFGGELSWVAVDPAHRGKGLGLAVSAAATQRLLDAGYTDVYLKTDDRRLAALKTYLRLGYLPFIHMPDMEQRWQTVCQALDWPSLVMVRGHWTPEATADRPSVVQERPTGCSGAVAPS